MGFWNWLRERTTQGDAAPQQPVNDSERLLFERVRGVLAEVRPLIRMDGGDLELVSVTPDGLVRVRMKGACVGCPAQPITLRQGVEALLRERIPEIRGVETV